MKTGFIEKFILPKSEDFEDAMRQQTLITLNIVGRLEDACACQREEALAAIREDAARALEMKNENMQRLLNVFLTPYDKESIYRFLTQLDWVVLSVKHFVIEQEVYGIASVADYREICALLTEMMTLLGKSFDLLAAREMIALAATTDRIEDKYDRVVEGCARAIATLLEAEDCREILRHRDIVGQLKEIAKRIHITANTLEDMAIKVV
ncbi:DUF47 family protein [Parahaliea maris]|uniref:DUF47 family protein n=1 Tax=Parahaliea maris TaxID=2716870 RepID=A0A5C9A8N1_9GAMM|nr:DUF47 family protein [Parahaliea maris]TXS96040.1 DUF47 family protein [Parahaliea maris]